jgi:hypothetical protein
MGIVRWELRLVTKKMLFKIHSLLGNHLHPTRSVFACSDGGDRGEILEVRAQKETLGVGVTRRQLLANSL